MASNDDVGVDPAAAKRYKFGARCEFILVRERKEGHTSVGCKCETGFFGDKTACFDGNAAAP